MVDEFLIVQQIANQLQAHIMSVYKLIREGKLKAIRVPGGGLRVEAKELEKLLGQTKRESRTSPEEKN